MNSPNEPFDPEKDYLNEVFKNPNTIYVYQASQTRGVLINQVILLERLMDSYICEYFCKEDAKAVELMDTIISTRRITFESKSQVLRTLLDRVNPNADKENSILAKDFQFIADERNKLAHYFLDTSQEAIKRFTEPPHAFTLLKFEKVRTPEIYDVERIKKIGNTIDSHTNSLLEKLNKLRAERVHQ